MISSPKIKSSDITTIYGLRGSGKTTLALSIVKNFKSLVIVDNGLDFSNLKFKKIHDINEISAGVQQIIARQRLDDEKEFFEKIAKKSMEIGNIHIFIDEGAFIFPINQQLSGYTKELIFYGRHRNVGLTIACQRPSELNSSVRSQSAHKFFLRLSEIVDLEIVKKYSNDWHKVSQLKHNGYLYVGDFTHFFEGEQK